MCVWKDMTYPESGNGGIFLSWSKFAILSKQANLFVFVIVLELELDGRLGGFLHR